VSGRLWLKEQFDIDDVPLSNAIWYPGGDDFVHGGRSQQG